MTTTTPFYTPVIRHASSSSEFESLLHGADIPEETSSLLQSKRAPRRTVSLRCKSARSSFLDDNFGLFLIAVAEFFVSATNMSVKLLNSSDEPMPILEVCVIGPDQIFSSEPSL